MAYVSFKTRKALGRRYGVDPALLLESERLQAEYSLAPGREARGMQASQFAQGLELQREGMKGAERGGMVGTVGNLATTAGVLRAMTLQKGEPFFGGLFGGASGAGAYSTGATQVAPGAFTVGGAAPFVSQTGTFVVNPALMGEGAAGITAGAAPAGAAVAPAAGAGATPAAGVAATEGISLAGYRLPASAGLLGGLIGAKLGQPIGEALGVGGKAERAIVGGALGGAGAGALAGMAMGSVGGPVGAVVGAGVGAVVGFVSKIFGW